MNDLVSLSFIFNKKTAGPVSPAVRYGSAVTILVLPERIPFYGVNVLEVYSFLQILFSVPQIFKEYLVTSLKGEVCSVSYSPALLLTG